MAILLSELALEIVFNSEYSSRIYQKSPNLRENPILPENKISLNSPENPPNKSDAKKHVSLFPRKIAKKIKNIISGPPMIEKLKLTPQNIQQTIKLTTPP